MSGRRDTSDSRQCKSAGLAKTGGFRVNKRHIEGHWKMLAAANLYVNGKNRTGLVRQKRRPFPDPSYRLCSKLVV